MDKHSWSEQHATARQHRRHNLLPAGNRKKVPNARKKKEEKKFIFDEENEIDANELFNENRSKLVNRGIDYRFEQKRKVKCFYHFDKLSQFKLFTISGKTITSKDIDDDLDLNQQEKNLEENKDGDMDDGGWEENDNQNDIVGFEKKNLDKL